MITLRIFADNTIDRGNYKIHLNHKYIYVVAIGTVILTCEIHVKMED